MTLQRSFRKPLLHSCDSGGRRSWRTTLVILSVIPSTLLLGCRTTECEKCEVDNSNARNERLARMTTAQLKTSDSNEKTTSFDVVAEFSNLTPGTTTVPLQVDEQKVSLRDDGLAPDGKAGDGRFSGSVAMGTPEFEAFAQRLRSPELMKSPRFGPGRSIVSRQQLLDLKALRSGRFVKIFPFPAQGNADNVDTARSLMVTDISVVNDPTRTFDMCGGPGNTPVGNPNGKWSFGHLVSAIANEPETGVSASTLVRRWLRDWEVSQTINFDEVPSRPNIRSMVIDPWQTASGGAGADLDMSKAPFRLLAIVNRVDLGGTRTYGGGSAGEGRFVFGVLGPNCASMRFTVILEYGVPKTSCGDIKAWGQEWVDLDDHPIGSPAYLAALEAITDQFAEPGADPSKLPNKSALNQLRTNENALAPLWELREWVVSSSPAEDQGLLRMVTVKQTPDFDLQASSTIDAYISAHKTDLLTAKHEVPLEFPGSTPFRGGAAPTPPNFFWRGVTPPPAPPTELTEARHMLSLNTCNGCHAGETSTPFLHVGTRQAGSTAPLSGFLRGIPVNDPVDSTPRTFNDLERRAVELDSLVNTPCLFRSFVPIPSFVH